MHAVQSKTILIIDDDADLREMMQLSLEAEGCHAIIAGGRESAMDWMIGHGIPDVIILDWHMSGMEIPEFFDHLMKMNAKLPRIILTTAGSHADTAARKFGIPEVLRKPFERSRLLEQVDGCRV